MGTEHYAVLGATVVSAYTVFGLTGFGAAMVAVPILVQFMPLQFVVPMLLLLDLVTTAMVGMRNWSSVSRPELLRLIPFMLVGVALGTTVLAQVESRWLLVALGLFVILMTARALLSASARAEGVANGWAVPAGVVGGIFSALFGTGGPIYTMYLSRRLPQIDAFRSTIAAVILLSALVRLAAFASSGLLQQEDLLRSAAIAMPFSLIGLAIGSRLRRVISADAVRRALLLFLGLSGASVLCRGLLMH
ncbi:sulfite exporter TauE/SafE family protein [Cupriavidus pauculus]|uniref:sulfite exporter TauE/SafE family protein n=1 Tax=Cupriavidus pauculus TaxID=82633 RepID=UPI001EE1FE96|nr:sulfite exporter TauE/SafE family protein [Cupriavidus pauculus]GJG98380.1 sulfite exporter TauE/SafE family protein [Cupriavidus pauculus]